MAKLPKAALDFFRKQGAKGGKIGGVARMENLTAEQRTELAKKAAAARWAKKPKRATRAKEDAHREHIGRSAGVPRHRSMGAAGPCNAAGRKTRSISGWH